MGKPKDTSVADYHLLSGLDVGLGMAFFHSRGEGMQDRSQGAERAAFAGAAGQNAGKGKTATADDRCAQPTYGRTGQERQRSGLAALKVGLFFTVLILFTSTSATAPIQRQSRQHRTGAYQEHTEQIRKYFEHRRQADSLDLVIQTLLAEISRHEH